MFNNIFRNLLSNIRLHVGLHRLTYIYIIYITYTYDVISFILTPTHTHRYHSDLVAIWKRKEAYILPIDCPLIALDEQMFSHNGYGPGRPWSQAHIHYG